jgi:nitroreductase
MNDNKLYETIFKRKSIRKYSQTLLPEKELSKLSNFIKELKPLYPAIITEINIVTPKDVKGLIQVNAPYYIASFSETKNGYLLNMGFLLQQIDLYLSANGLGSCWQGWPKPTKELRIYCSIGFWFPTKEYSSQF